MTLRRHTLIAGVILALGPIYGHHSFSAEYDRNQPITLHGTVTHLDWMNPHAMLYVDVSAPPGKLTTWEFELGSPNGLMKTGWNRYSLRKGDAVTINGYRARDGSNLVNASRIVLSDGKSVLSPLSSADESAK